MGKCFSALQRAENSSIGPVGAEPARRLLVSVLFSEPKIPQLAYATADAIIDAYVSVLFSEPKIPQSYGLYAGMSKLYVSVLFSEPKIPQYQLFESIWHWQKGFSALQRAENSSISEA